MKGYLIAVCLWGCAAPRSEPTADAGGRILYFDRGMSYGWCRLSDGGSAPCARAGSRPIITDKDEWDAGWWNASPDVQTLAQLYESPETKFVVWDQETAREALTIDRHGKLTLEEPMDPAAEAFVKAVHRMWELEDNRRPLCRRRGFSGGWRK